MGVVAAVVADESELCPSDDEDTTLFLSPLRFVGIEGKPGFDSKSTNDPSFTGDIRTYLGEMME